MRKIRISVAAIICVLAMTISCLAKYDSSVIMQVQEALNATGYDCGPADGVPGNATVAAVTAYQHDHGLTADGQINDELLISLGLMDNGTSTSNNGTNPNNGTSPNPGADTNISKGNGIGSGVAIGDSITFGHYEQDNNTSNGNEPIEWRVLDKNGEKALVISKYGLVTRAYNSEWTEVTWETCDLRRWLNDRFYHEAFSEEERQQIAIADVVNEDTKFDAGNDTTDYVFLLSIIEAEDLFTSNNDRVCYPTEYAKAQEAWFDEDTGSCYWWLRSPGDLFSIPGELTSSAASGIFGNGAVDTSGYNVDFATHCVRPAMWINLG